MSGGLRRFLLFVVLMDIPVLVGVALVGAVYGYGNTWDAVYDWRTAHPWSMVPSVALAGLLAWRWRGGRTARHT